MKLNRRDFLKGLGAAAAVTALPMGGEWVEAKPIPPVTPPPSAGIENMGNGWYRCWCHFGDQLGSIYAKADKSPFLTLNIPTGVAHFDLEKGLVTSMSDKPVMQDTYHVGAEATIWGAQLECTSPSTTYAEPAKPLRNGLSAETPKMNKIAQSVGLGCNVSQQVP